MGIAIITCIIIIMAPSIVMDISEVFTVEAATAVAVVGIFEA